MSASRRWPRAHAAVSSWAVTSRRTGELRGLLRASGISWIEDPSNRDVRYTRARIRASLAGDPGRVASLLKMAAENGVRLAAIRNDAQERLARAGCSLHAGGAISLDLSALGCGAAAAEAFRSILPIVSGRVPSVGDVPIMNLLCRGSGTIAGAVLWPQGGLGWVGCSATIWMRIGNRNEHMVFHLIVVCKSKVSADCRGAT